MRTFVAIEISNEKVIDEISKFQSRININAKPVEPKNLHFTLQFLGDISEEDSENILNALRTIEFSSFKIHFRGIGVFPKLKFPRVIWVGTDDVGGNLLVDLANKVQKVLHPLGFSSDKPFKAHITVFRIKNKIPNIKEELDRFDSIDFGSQEISTIKFKKSFLTPEGPIYSDLGEVRAKL